MSGPNQPVPYTETELSALSEETAVATSSLDRFKELAALAGRDGGLVPVWRDVLLDCDTAVSAYARLRRAPFSFLLESAPAGGETWSRYTFLGTEPRAAWRLVDDVVDEWSPELGWHGARRSPAPLDDLKQLLARTIPVDAPEVDGLWNGVVGYLSYDVARLVERLPNPPARVLRTPDALMMVPGVVVVLDNLKGMARVVTSVSVRPGTNERELGSLYGQAVQELNAVVDRLHSSTSHLRPLTLDPDAPAAQGKSSYTKERFMEHVERIREYIMAGDCFQALLARRISLPHDFDGLELYRALRALNPSPYMYHLALDGVELVGCSPELLVRVANERVTVRPIAGTRPRGVTPAADEEMTGELLGDEKERAEHVMLVDLGRNDVGRISRYGSVRVTDLMHVERYSHVLHLVSQVEGELRPGVTAVDAFAATFPAGTMTGAPKVRAMEIIDELEPERRGPYAGAVGWIAAGDRRMDLAITIRTCVIAGGEASVQAGAGIVADSVPELEWKETENKARAVLSAIGQVRASMSTGGNA